MANDFKFFSIERQVLVTVITPTVADLLGAYELARSCPDAVRLDSRATRVAPGARQPLAPLAGAVDGVNERGLALTYNYAFAIDEASPAPPISLTIAATLARCETVTQAAAWMAAQPRCGAGLVLLADAAGDLASLELSHTRSFLRRPTGNEDAIFHSNCYVGESMRQVEVPREAVFSNKAPRVQQGRRVLQSPELRQTRLAELLREPARLGPDDLARLMADHGPTGNPNDDTLCMHGSYWFTTACLQWFPVSRRVRVAYDTACRARYVEFRL